MKNLVNIEVSERTKTVIFIAVWLLSVSLLIIGDQTGVINVNNW